MCDMQKMPSREDASCEEDSDMNFATFTPVGTTGTHFMTTSGQLPVQKLQQNVANNGAGMPQVCVMGDGGVQYMRAIDTSGTLQATPQLISVPVALPGAKPGDPQATVQIQVLSPNLLPQQPKYQMQIPIQGYQQVLTVDAGGIQLVGQGSLGEGLQVLAALPQEMQLVQPTQEKEQIPQNMPQVYITPNQQIIINGADKALNNNTTSDNHNPTTIVIKEECDDDESSQGTEIGETIQWQLDPNHQQDIVKYLRTLPPQQTQALPESLQQFLRLNPTDIKQGESIEIEVESAVTKKEEPVAEAVLSEDGTLRIQSKKKKKYKKKPPKPAKPKPGTIVIATSLDGSPIFCCPECQMAYPEKEQLEMHLIVHKIERRFICGICGAGLKRKEHLERHKLGHNPERPFVCDVCRKGFKRREHLNLHTVIHSGVKTEMCTECGKGFYRKDHLRKHTRSHESKRARDEAAGGDSAAAPQPVQPAPANNNILPEITIHIPTSSNSQIPVQINIPPHVVSSLGSQAGSLQAGPQLQAGDTLDALLAQAHHS
ncbi:specificity protein transcription factor 3 isoform X1 [Spodoptera frugiperda]|uniref:Specificity protein transcription factor 3 isoform X1 n=2 Tax=Spodoptera frugiperda TaxID=7108 RepID=A0A9R0CY36_SPOFR|nr:specificity protein transcription factor 3 isoform X1 [Spodoptera frugiperda]